MNELSADDRLSLLRIVAEYAHVMDSRDFQGLDRIFSRDAQFDATAFGVARCNDLGEIIALMTSETRHPVAHHTTDVMVCQAGHRSATLRSKGLAVSTLGTVTSLVYLDVAVLTDDGWRIQSRIARPL
ncbi:MAG: nuclear transport factor 2 family protein [Aeromicrobium sp.]